MKYTILLALLLAGCDMSPPPVSPKKSFDQCLRATLFQRCMQLLPAGPDHTRYNDWSEVVDACEEAAKWQSMRFEAYVKPECRA